MLDEAQCCTSNLISRRREDAGAAPGEATIGEAEGHPGLARLSSRLRPYGAPGPTGVITSTPTWS